MPKAGKRRTRGVPGTGTETETEAKKAKRSLEEDRPVMFATFESEKSQSKAKSDRVDDDVDESSTEESSDPPSPLLHRPYIPDELADRANIQAAFQEAKASLVADEALRADFIMARYNDPSCLFEDRRLLHIREPAKDAVLLAANSVISISSYLDDEPLNRCCGLWIQRDDQKKTALVLTSAHLIRAKDPPFMRNLSMSDRTGNYHREASVIVHLLDGATASASLIYLQEHYEFALYEVQVDKLVQLSCFNDNVHSGQDVFRLGRDEDLDLRITHGMVEYRIPIDRERGHCMYFSPDGKRSVRNKQHSYRSLFSTEQVELHDDGGPIIDLEGKVVGMVDNEKRDTFLPSSVLHKCLDMWRKLKRIPRPHLGMTFTSIKLLDPVCIEGMRRKHNIDSGLIVEQVSKDSNAEKLGIRKGDTIERLNGEYISTTVELEKMLLDISRDHFHQAEVLNGKINIRIQIFHGTKFCRRARNLTVIVSECGEDIIEGTYPITVGLWR